MTWIACARKCEIWNNQGNVGNFMLVPMVKGGRERTTGNEVNGVDRGEENHKGSCIQSRGFGHYSILSNINCHKLKGEPWIYVL